jgi:hypothetical protein
MAMGVAIWLQQLGLAQYEPVFREKYLLIPAE